MNKSRCLECANCCGYEIPTTLHDVHRLAAQLGVAPERVFCEYIGDTISASTALLKLRKTPLGTCVFLSQGNRCSVHGAHPRVCSLYFCKQPEAVRSHRSSRCHGSSRALEHYEHSIAAEVTRVYIATVGAQWNEDQFHRAIKKIREAAVPEGDRKVRVARNCDGSQFGLSYDCSQCDDRGTHADETPVTLLDIDRISSFLKMPVRQFFEDKIERSHSRATGTLMFKRPRHCIFFDAQEHCTILPVQPMHCRFTCCPKMDLSEDLRSRLYLGSGSLVEQYEHQVALSITRNYVERCQTTYNQQAYDELLGECRRLSTDDAAFQVFQADIAPYRYRTAPAMRAPQRT